MAPTYKVIYFDARGKAELLRILFHAAGQSFEDVRLTRDQVNELKPELPFEQLPVLQMDGTYYAQSVALASYLAREFGFYGKSNMEGLLIDQVLQGMSDLVAHIVKFFMEKDEAKKEELKKALKETTVPKWFNFFVRLLERNKTGYFAGSELTLADMAVYDLGDMLTPMDIFDINDYPALKTSAEKVTSHPKIAEYMKERK